jgi:PIN domain nuclease of toxin-antitoxin system
LGKRARRIFQEVDQGKHSIIVPMMALEETARLAERSVIALAIPFRRWAEELDRSPNFQIQPYTMEILFESVSLQSLREPGDRRYSKASALPIDHRRLNDSPRKVDRDALGLAQ